MLLILGDGVSIIIVSTQLTVGCTCVCVQLTVGGVCVCVCALHRKHPVYVANVFVVMVYLLRGSSVEFLQIWKQKGVGLW